MGWFDKKSIISLIVEAVLFLGIISFGYNLMNKKLDTSEQNLIAYKGKMEQLELKNGELITVRDSYIMDKNQLEEELGVTKKEVKDLEKKLESTLAYISNIESQVRIDTIETVRDSIIYINDSDIDVKFNYSDEWLSFNGLTRIRDTQSNTSLRDVNMKVPLTIGLTDNYKLFIQSDNPYVNFTYMEGAVMDGSNLIKKPRRFGLSVQGGMGVNYDLISKQLGVGPYLGLGIHWRIW
jgi:hypothetical protein